MAKYHKPVAGSRAYWPRKRAKSIYPSIKTGSVKVQEAVPLGFAGYKAGMLRVSVLDNRKGSATQGQEIVRPITVLDTPSIIVCGIKAYRKGDSGLKEVGTIWSEKIEKDLKRKTRVPNKPDQSKVKTIEEQVEKLSDVRLLVYTKPRESGIRKKRPEMFEIGIGGEIRERWNYAKERLGKEIKVSEVFKEGELIDTRSVSKGKGFQGPVKRFGVKVRSRKDKGKRRHVGTLGAVTPGRVLPGKLAMAGQLGYQTRTEYNKKVIKIESKVNPKGGWLNYGLIPGECILIEGSIPGPQKRLIMLRKGLRSRGKIEPMEVKKVFLESQQGA